MDEKEQIMNEIERLKKQLEDLSGQLIDFELPKNYDQMTEEEKKAYHKKQDSLKLQAMKNMNNYSVVRSHTMVSYPLNRSCARNFLREVGALTSIPLERDTFKRTIPEKYKILHKENLEEIDKLIERYNSTKAIRNDRVEFGANFSNFAETYFNKRAVLNLERDANNIFLAKYDRQEDKNGNIIGDKFKFQNLTEEQKKYLIKTRIKVFSEKLGYLQKIASIKVKNDSQQKLTTFMEKYGFLSNQEAFRDGSKKFTTVKSVVSKSGIDMSKVKLQKSELKSKNTSSVSRRDEAKSRYIEINTMRDKFDSFIKFYKGNGRQFSMEFEQNFPEIAEKLYKQKAGSVLSFRSQNLASSPISVQQHEIEKQFEEELRKVNYRLRYASFYIPASVSQASAYLGKSLTNSKTQTEKDFDQMRVKEYEKELRNISLREDLIGYESIFGSLNKGVQDEFTEYVKKHKKNFEKLSEVSKKSELKKFISNKIDKLKETVHKNKFFSLGTEKLEKLNGVLISRKEKMITKEMKGIIDTLGVEQGEIYKHLIQSVKEFTNKYNNEKQVIDKLGEKLEALSSKPYSYETNSQMQSIIKDIDSHNKKLAIIKSSLNNAVSRKSVFESNFASQQIDKAMTSTKTKAVSFNTAKSVFDKYAFPALDAFGETYFIEKNSIEGKQVEKIVASFIMNFKNQVQHLNLTFSDSQYDKLQEFSINLADGLDDDFGSNIRDLKKTQKVLKSELEKAQNQNDSGLANELETYIQRFSKVETELIKKLKSMNIEIGDVTLAKNKK